MRIRTAADDVVLWPGRRAQALRVVAFFAAALRVVAFFAGALRVVAFFAFLAAIRDFLAGALAAAEVADVAERR